MEPFSSPEPLLPSSSSRKGATPFQEDRQPFFLDMKLVISERGFGEQTSQEKEETITLTECLLRTEP